MRIDPIHFEKLLECHCAIHEVEGLKQEAMAAPLGRSASKWWETVQRSSVKLGVDVDPNNLTSRPLGRSDLERKIQDFRSGRIDQPLEELLIEILAWGLMSSRNGRFAFMEPAAWIDYCRKLINENNVTPVQAYERFFSLHHGGKMKGIGPAYYTKLVFFLASSGGLIMDQWTARSACLLAGSDFLTLSWQSKNAYVSKFNTPFQYEKFLKLVKSVQGAISDLTGDNVELSDVEWLLFSQSPSRKLGSLKGERLEKVRRWRRYVVSESARD